MRLRIRLTAMGFLPQSRTSGDEFAPESVAADEVVRVRVLPAWLRNRRAVRHRVPQARRPAVVLR